MNRASAVNEMKATWAVLNSDLDAAVEYGKKANTPYAQRALTRALFAAIEGLAYSLRQVTLASLYGTKLLTQDELVLLREVSIRIDDGGKVKAREAYLPFPQSLLFSVRMYVKNHGAKFEIDKSQKGWQALQIAINARNHITHPKSAASLTLTNEELQALMETAEWWKSSMLALFKACEEADIFWRKKIEGNSQ